MSEPIAAFLVCNSGFPHYLFLNRADAEMCADSEFGDSPEVEIKEVTVRESREEVSPAPTPGFNNLGFHIIRVEEDCGHGDTGWITYTVDDESGRKSRADYVHYLLWCELVRLDEFRVAAEIEVDLLEKRAEAAESDIRELKAALQELKDVALRLSLADASHRGCAHCSNHPIPREWAEINESIKKSERVLARVSEGSGV